MASWSEADLRPDPGETARQYTERMNAQGVGTYLGLEEHFGYSKGAAKGMWLASEEFNCRFAFSSWSDRLKRSPDGYGARNWLKRQYSLSDQQVDWVVLEFERGNDRGLLVTMDFEQLAKSRVREDLVGEMEERGAFK